MAKSRIRNQKKAKKVTRTRVQTRRNSQSKIRGKKQSKNRNVPRTKRARRRNNKRGGATPEDHDLNLEIAKQFFINYIPVDGKYSDIIAFIKDVAKRYYGQKYKPRGPDIKLNGVTDSVFKSCQIKQSGKDKKPQISLGTKATNWETIITCKDTRYSITLEINDESYEHPENRFNYDVIVKKEVKTDQWDNWYRFQAPSQLAAPTPQLAAPPAQLLPPPQGFEAPTREFAQDVVRRVKDTRL